jgi:RNA polymerase sigma-32 factor
VAKAPPKKKAPAKASAKSSAKPSARKKAPVAKAVPREVEIVEPETASELEPGLEFEGGVSQLDPNVANEEAYRSAELVDPDLLKDDFVAPEIAKAAVAAGKAAAAKDIKTSRLPKVVNPEVVEEKGLAAANDPIATYLAEIRRYPLLTKEQEQALAQRYRETGDPKAAEQLVTSNLRFVVKVAAEYSRFGAKLIDLIQEGNVGLMHAVKEFNPYKGVRLITYAVWWIRGYIQEYLMRQYSLVRIGTTQNQRKLFYRLQKEQAALDSQGHAPTVAMIAGKLGVSEEEVETMSKRLSGRDVSLSAPIDSENPVAPLLDFEAAPEPAVDESIGNLEELNVLKENLEKLRPSLSAKETYILEKRILADEPQTLQEIGEHYGVTREAVRQLEARLIGKIRKAVTESLD